MIEDVELESPDNVGGIFNVSAFFERRERNGLYIIVTIERADNDESRVSIALKFFKFANGIINAELGRIF